MSIPADDVQTEASILVDDLRLEVPIPVDDRQLDVPILVDDPRLDVPILVDDRQPEVPPSLPQAGCAFSTCIPMPVLNRRRKVLPPTIPRSNLFSAQGIQALLPVVNTGMQVKLHHSCPHVTSGSK